MGWKKSMFNILCLFAMGVFLEEQGYPDLAPLVLIPIGFEICRIFTYIRPTKRTMLNILCLIVADSCMHFLGCSMLCRVCAALVILEIRIKISTYIFTYFRPTMTIILAGALLVVLRLLLVIFLRRETLEGRDGILDEPYDIFAPIKEYYGWGEITIIRDPNYIPNHKLADNVVSNLTKNWHLQHYITIRSFDDINIIKSIVADMREVLAKNPQVEQQTVFLEDTNPGNQARKILISCFLKTSHYEEYFYVREDILLDIRSVVSHHRARLATPIRTVDEPVASDSKNDENFAGTSTSLPGVNSSKPNSDSQSVVSETSPITSHEFGRGETAATSHLKQEEKSLVF